MAESINKLVAQSVNEAENLYHRLVLLVGSSGSGKTGVLLDIASEFGVDVINVNLAIAGELLELTPKQRSLRLPAALDRILPTSQTITILDNLEILFDLGLQQNPLRLLQGISRNRTVLASWSGSLLKGNLLYAEPGHPEYRSYDSVDALIVEMKESHE